MTVGEIPAFMTPESMRAEVDRILGDRWGLTPAWSERAARGRLSLMVWNGVPRGHSLGVEVPIEGSGDEAIANARSQALVVLMQRARELVESGG